MEALVRRMEDLAKSLAGPTTGADAALSPTTRLATMLREALAANTKRAENSKTLSRRSLRSLRLNVLETPY